MTTNSNEPNSNEPNSSELNATASFITRHTDLAKRNNSIDPAEYGKYSAKRGLRNEDGTGVLVGLTEIGEVHGYVIDDQERVPDEGRLSYRGYNLKDIVRGFQQDGRFGFEEVAYLLVFGELPSAEELAEFRSILGHARKLPERFVEDSILRFPSKDIMNKLGRSVLVAYSFDDNPDDLSIENVVRQTIELTARFPAMAAYGYQAKKHYYDGESLFLHAPDPELSTAENLLQMIRPNRDYTALEAEVLDLALVLHAEHGGGNNSAFTVHVVSSAGTDTYSAIAAGLGSLKGPKHGGAANQVHAMMEHIKSNVGDWDDDDEVAEYLRKILRGEAYDRSGLIYGMGHAVYTLSDPRAVMLKEKAAELAESKAFSEELGLLRAIERLTPNVVSEVKGRDMVIAPNVDYYSGFVYRMLNIPTELYTPIFAVARVAGWCAHRLEELISGGRIIRPAYKSIVPRRRYTPMGER